MDINRGRGRGRGEGRGRGDGRGRGRGEGIGRGDGRGRGRGEGIGRGRGEGRGRWGYARGYGSPPNMYVSAPHRYTPLLKKIPKHDPYVHIRIPSVNETVPSGAISSDKQSNCINNQTPLDLLLKRIGSGSYYKLNKIKNKLPIYVRYTDDDYNSKNWIPNKLIHIHNNVFIADGQIYTYNNNELRASIDKGDGTDPEDFVIAKIAHDNDQPKIIPDDKIIELAGAQKKREDEGHLLSEKTKIKQIDGGFQSGDLTVKTRDVRSLVPFADKCTSAKVAQGLILHDLRYSQSDRKLILVYTTRQEKGLCVIYLDVADENAAISDDSVIIDLENVDTLKQILTVKIFNEIDKHNTENSFAKNINIVKNTQLKQPVRIDNDNEFYCGIFSYKGIAFSLQGKSDVREEYAQYEIGERGGDYSTIKLTLMVNTEPDQLYECNAILYKAPPDNEILRNESKQIKKKLSELISTKIIMDNDKICKKYSYVDAKNNDDETSQYIPYNTWGVDIFFIDIENKMKDLQNKISSLPFYVSPPSDYDKYNKTSYNTTKLIVDIITRIEMHRCHNMTIIRKKVRGIIHEFETNTRNRYFKFETQRDGLETIHARLNEIYVPIESGDDRSEYREDLPQNDTKDPLIALNEITSVLDKCVSYEKDGKYVNINDYVVGYININSIDDTVKYIKRGSSTLMITSENIHRTIMRFLFNIYYEEPTCRTMLINLLVCAIVLKGGGTSKENIDFAERIGLKCDRGGRCIHMKLTADYIDDGLFANDLIDLLKKIIY